MDAYPSSLIDHNLPLFVVSGLTPDPVALDQYPFIEENGFRISSDIPPVESEDAKSLLKHFESFNASDPPWNNKDHNGHKKLRVRTVGRVCHRIYFSYFDGPQLSVGAKGGNCCCVRLISLVEYPLATAHSIPTYEANH
jgi:hypothetical protein